jgi:hypothetical protein
MPKSTFPDFVSPMMAESAKAPFDSPDWIFEIKLDGYRAITVFDTAVYGVNGILPCLAARGQELADNETAQSTGLHSATWTEIKSRKTPSGWLKNRKEFRNFEYGIQKGFLTWRPVIEVFHPRF